MDGLHRPQRATGLHPGGNLHGDGGRDEEMQDGALVRSSGRSRSGAVFILTSSGLRRMGLGSGLNQLDSDGGGFLGYPGGEILWKDAFDLVHEDGRHLLWFLISLVIEEPGSSESMEIRFCNAWGNSVLMDVSALHVPGAPTGDGPGQVVVNARHARRDIHGHEKVKNGSR
jgi:hypothetical protein